MSASGLGIALMATFMAAGCTVLGSCLIFFPQLHGKAFVGPATAFAAGVMLYVAFMEVTQKSYDSLLSFFDDQTEPAYTLLSIGIFAGMSFMWGIDSLICLLFAKTGAGVNAQPGSRSQSSDELGTESQKPKETRGISSLLKYSLELISCARLPVCGKSGEGLLSTSTDSCQSQTASSAQPEQCKENQEISDCLKSQDMNGSRKSQDTENISTLSNIQFTHAVMKKQLNEEDPKAAQRRFLRSAVILGAAVAMHGFPEGLATFVACYDDATVGIPVAIAMAIPNIPEGMCLAIPAYHGTGSKFKAIGIAAFISAAEPLGGLVAWAALRGNDIGDFTYGVIFAAVAGIMVYVALKEMLPTAIRLDPDDKHATLAVVAGMALMACLLVFFASV